MDDIDMLFDNIPPCLRGNFKELFHFGKIGISPFTFHDISFTKLNHNSTFCYYYTLKIPYAGKRLSWELIFNPEDLNFAPDFNFNDESFYMSHNLDLIIENIPSLVKWNVHNPKSLTCLLQEFLSLFKKQQIERLHKENIYSLISKEYQQFIDETGTSNDLEIYLENSAAHVLIIIKVDTSILPEYSQLNDDLLNPGEDICILKVSYMKLDGSRVNTSLQLSPRLEQVFGSIKSLHIPIYSEQSSLVDYTTQIKTLIQDQIRTIEEHYVLKKKFMNCLYIMFNDKVLEFDSETFCKAVFLCEVNGYCGIIHVNIGKSFPQEKPRLTLHLLYCTLPDKPCIEELKDYPYSPRWAPQDMLEKMITYVTEVLPKFKSHKH